jgi:hypothetical protein
LPPDSGIGLHLGPEAQIPDHPGSMVNIPRPPTQTFTPLVTTPAAPRDIRNMRANCLFGLREFITLQNKRTRFDASSTTVDIDTQLRTQANVVIADLRLLQAEIRALAKKAEDHRWRRWIVGGAL